MAANSDIEHSDDLPDVMLFSTTQWSVVLKHVLHGDGAEFTFADVAAELGQTKAAARMAASRLRQRYRELLREEISQTLSSQDDIDDEIRSLFAAF